MEEYLFRRYGIKYKQVWFFDGDDFTDNYRLSDADIVEFKESYKAIEGLYPFFNGVIDLKKSLGEIHNGFDKGFKYEIRRAEKENFECSVYNLSNEEQLKNIFSYYLQFCKKKNIVFINYRFIKAYLSKDSLIISVAKANESILQYHIYYKSNAELILLASFPAPSAAVKKTSLGFANRALHWFDIQLAAQLKLRTYNLGGIGNNVSDPQILSIANFKMEMSPESKVYYQGLLPLTLKGKFFLRIKSRAHKYVTANTASIN